MKVTFDVPQIEMKIIWLSVFLITRIFRWNKELLIWILLFIYVVSMTLLILLIVESGSCYLILFDPVLDQFNMAKFIEIPL